MALLCLSLHTLTPAAYRACTSPWKGGQGWAVAKVGQAALLPHPPPEAGGTQPRALTHLPSHTQPGWCPHARAPLPPRSSVPPSPSEAWHCKEETPAAGLCFPRLHVCPTPQRPPPGTLPLPSRPLCSLPRPLQPRPATGSSHGLGTVPNVPLNPARPQAGGVPSQSSSFFSPTSSSSALTAEARRGQEGHPEPREHCSAPGGGWGGVSAGRSCNVTPG